MQTKQNDVEAATKMVPRWATKAINIEMLYSVVFWISSIDSWPSRHSWNAEPLPFVSTFIIIIYFLQLNSVYLISKNVLRWCASGVGSGRRRIILFSLFNIEKSPAHACKSILQLSNSGVWRVDWTATECMLADDPIAYTIHPIDPL